MLLLCPQRSGGGWTSNNNNNNNNNEVAELVEITSPASNLILCAECESLLLLETLAELAVRPSIRNISTVSSTAFC